MTGDTGMDGARTSIATHDGDAVDPWTKTHARRRMGEAVMQNANESAAMSCTMSCTKSGLCDGDGWLTAPSRLFDICPSGP